MSTAVSPSPEVSSPEGFSTASSAELAAGGAGTAVASAGTAGAASAGHGADAPFTSPAAKLRGRELDRQILALALPALGGLVASPIFVMIDSSMVGHLGADPLAALSLASSILTTAVGLFVFLTYATTATTARHFGAGRRREGLKAGLDGIWLAALIGVAVAGVAMVFAPQIVAAMGAKASVATNAVAYLRMVLPGLPGMLVVLAATGTLRGLLDTRTPFIVALAGAVLNTLLNAFFLYVVGLGVAGSGLGTALAELSMGAALVAPIARAAHAEQVSLRPRLDGLRASMGEGLGLFVRNISLRVAILSTVWAATALGATALASYQVVNALWGVCSFGLDALAIAAQALIGQALGRAAEARRRGDEVALAQEGDKDAAVGVVTAGDDAAHREILGDALAGEREGVAHVQAARRGVGRANDRAGRVIIRRPRALKTPPAAQLVQTGLDALAGGQLEVVAKPRPRRGHVFAAGVGRRHVQQRRKVENVVGPKDRFDVA